MLFAPRRLGTIEWAALLSFQSTLAHILFCYLFLLVILRRPCHDDVSWKLQSGPNHPEDYQIRGASWTSSLCEERSGEDSGPLWALPLDRERPWCKLEIKDSTIFFMCGLLVLFWLNRILLLCKLPSPLSIHCTLPTGITEPRPHATLQDSITMAKRLPSRTLQSNFDSLCQRKHEFTVITVIYVLNPG